MVRPPACPPGGRAVVRYWRFARKRRFRKDAGRQRRGETRELLQLVGNLREKPGRIGIAAKPGFLAALTRQLDGIALHTTLLDAAAVRNPAGHSLKRKLRVCVPLQTAGWAAGETASGLIALSQIRPKPQTLLFRKALVRTPAHETCQVTDYVLVRIVLRRIGLSGKADVGAFREGLDAFPVELLLRRKNGRKFYLEFIESHCRQRQNRVFPLRSGIREQRIRGITTPPLQLMTTDNHIDTNWTMMLPRGRNFRGRTKRSSNLEDRVAQQPVGPAPSKVASLR